MAAVRDLRVSMSLEQMLEDIDERASSNGPFDASRRPARPPSQSGMGLMPTQRQPAKPSPPSKKAGRWKKSQESGGAPEVRECASGECGLCKCCTGPERLADSQIQRSVLAGGEEDPAVADAAGPGQPPTGGGRLVGLSAGGGSGSEEDDDDSDDDSVVAYSASLRVTLSQLESVSPAESASGRPVERCGQTPATPPLPLCPFVPRPAPACLPALAREEE